MNDLGREYLRWLEAERTGHDEDADEACRSVFAHTVPPQLARASFAAETLARIAAVSAPDARRTRRVRLAALWTAATAGPVALYFGAAALISAAASVLIGGLDLLVQAIVRLSSAGDWSVWALAGSIGRAIAAVMSDSDVTLVMLAMHGIAVAALVALQRLLGPET